MKKAVIVFQIEKNVISKHVSFYFLQSVMSLIDKDYLQKNTQWNLNA